MEGFMFDFNFDGKIDAFDLALGCMMFEEFQKQEQREQLLNNMCSVGVDNSDLDLMDNDELDLMDNDELEDFLFENDLDADDFDF